MTNEKKAFRINIVDVLITLIIIGILTVGALMIASAFDVNNVSEEGTSVVYTVQFKKILSEFSENIKVGDTVVDAQKRHNLGVVDGVTTKFYELEIYDNENNSRKIATNPDYITINMDVRATAYVSGGMCYLKDSGKEIGIGTAMYIHLPDFCGIGYISDMVVVE